MLDQPAGLSLGRPPMGPSTPAPGREMNLGGVMSARPLSALLQDEQDAAIARAEAQNNEAHLLSLASHIRKAWTRNKQAKQPIELQMIDALRAKRGEYSPEKLQVLSAQGSSTIYMMVFATKARQFKALLADAILGTGADKPFTMRPSPSPQLPEDLTAQILQAAQMAVMQAEQMGMPMTMDDVRQLLRDAKARADAQIHDEAKARCERAEHKVEDLLVEGGYLDALDQFLSDLPVFKTAFIKGPVVRNVGTLKWAAQPDGTSQPIATYEKRPHWERVDPLNIYPSPGARDLQDGDLIERHRLTPAALNELIGVEGYNDDAIRAVIDEFGIGGLHEWLSVDTMRAVAEGRLRGTMEDSEGLIDALQYWGRVTGKMLLEWGMPAEMVDDPTKSYDVEAWLIDRWVIKAVINNDPLARRPYYSDSFERVPGTVWGVSMYDTMRDCEDMCNGAARALSNNMGISSGPQVWVNADRLPSDEDIETMYPWKIWQTTNDPMGSSAAPMGFFQPTSNAQELMSVFEKYSALADEYTGVPRYMAGVDSSGGSAASTASGMSMMIGNANKTIKKAVASLDANVINPMVASAFEFMMRYIPDPDIKGDVNIVARGAMSLVAKDAAQVRVQQFLQATANPIDMQIIGMDGRAALLREVTKTLDINGQDIIPPVSVVKMRAAQAQMAAQQQQAAQEAAAQEAQTSDKPGERRLMNGAPATDTFAQQRGPQGAPA